MGKEFTREDTRVIKGIGVIILLFYHMCPFTDRLPVGFAWQAPFGLYDTRWLENIGWSFRIAPYLFLFIGGYGLYHQIKSGRKLHTILFRLYTNYWKVFLIFVPIALIFFSRQPGAYLNDASLCSVYADFSMRDLALNFLGLEFTFNREWWFITAYAAATVTGYILIVSGKKDRSFWAEAALVLLIGFGIDGIVIAEYNETVLAAFRDDFVFNSLVANTGAVYFYMGIVFAKHDGLAVMREMAEKYSRAGRALIALIGLLLIFVIRQTDMASDALDVVILPFLTVLCILLADAVPFVRKPLAYLGKHCNNIWLIHSFYCYYFYAATRIVYCTADPVIDLVILLGLSLVSSISVDWFWAQVKKLSEKLKKVPTRA